MPRSLARAALLALLATCAHPALADGWVDNVDGITLDEKGAVVRFAGLTITPDGRVGRLLRRGDKPPSKPEWRLDGKRRVLLPGLIDAHGHVAELGFSALQLDLSDTTSLADAMTKLANYARANPDKRYILGSGWNQEKWGLGRFPTAADVDAAVSDRPVLLTRVDNHAVLVNSAVLRLAGITPSTRNPAGGRIEREAKGVATGVFVDAARELVERIVPPPQGRDRDAAVLKAQEILLGLGITGIADMGTTVDDWNAFRRLGDAGSLRVRITSYAAGIEPAVTVAGSKPTPWLYDDRLRMVGIKLYADGALGSRGAWLKAPYADAATRGLPLIDDAKLRNLMSRASMDGFQIALHAIGDAANGQALAAIEELGETYKGDRRWRVEHAQIVDPADLPRFGRAGIVASMQPVHQTSDRTMAEARLGPNRLGGAYAWASMLRGGARVAFGSDTPVESANPFAGLAAAVTREGPDGQPAGGWQPQERVTREAAFAGFTTAAAHAGFGEDRVGRLAPGYRADFILVDRDPLVVTPAELRGTRVLETWIGGKRVYGFEVRR